MPMHFLPSAAAAILLAVTSAAQVAAKESPDKPAQAPNPYKLQPFHAAFPVELQYPPHLAREYVRTRRQILEQLAANLQGNVSRDAWLIASEFFWRAPEDAIEPLIEAMDRAFGKDGLDDVVKNCVEAMGRMSNEAFDGALRRALRHKNDIVRQAAFAAVCTSGKLETLREIGPAFAKMDGRARASWLRAVRVRLPLDEAEKHLTSVMMGEHATHVRDQVLKEAMQLPMSSAAKVLRGRWPDAVAEFKAIIAGVMHAAGDSTGTTWLLASFDGEDVERLVFSIRHCAYGELGELRQPLLRASTHLRGEVRLEVARALVRVAGDDVADVYEVLVAPTESWDVRAIALRELTRRGRPKMVAALLDELPTAIGTRLTSVIAELSASGDPRAVPVLLDRFAKAPDGESRPFLQGLAQNHSDDAAKALVALYRGPEKVVGRGSRDVLTTRNYLPTLFLNLRGSERIVLAGFLALPKDDWALRAPLLVTLAGIAADREDKAMQAEFIEPVRAILFDRSEPPQMRVLALNQLATRWLTIDDVLRLKTMHRDEAPGLRALFADFLNDAF